MKSFDRIIIGAGFYGLYAALSCGRKKEKVLVLELEDRSFSRASSNNQARVHMGYHYPRSISTALKSRDYFDRFVRDFGFCINNKFEQIYATSKIFSWTSSDQFARFCSNAAIPCEEVPVSKYFKNGMCDGAYGTTEFSYDPQTLKEYLLREILNVHNVSIKYGASIQSIGEKNRKYLITLQDGEQFQTGFVLNATYAAINQVQRHLGFEPLKIKYELCEVILCRANDHLSARGITVMDGPFFSIMPYGNTGLHTLTTVTFTPHATSFTPLPIIDCQSRSNGYCSELQLGNCDTCPAKPDSEWFYMLNLAKKYLKDEYRFEYVRSLFAIKPILLTSEIDDSRPTLIKTMSTQPTFVSVLSGKINTVYDLDEVLEK